jgi:hypothetical protein
MGNPMSLCHLLFKVPNSSAGHGGSIEWIVFLKINEDHDNICTLDPIDVFAGKGAPVVPRDVEKEC